MRKARATYWGVMKNPGGGLAGIRQGTGVRLHPGAADMGLLPAAWMGCVGSAPDSPSVQPKLDTDSPWGDRETGLMGRKEED